MNLLFHSFARVRTLVLSVGFLLGLLQIILILVARSLETSGQFAQLAELLPPFVRALLGPAMTAFLSFSGIVSLGYFEPAVLFAVVGLAIAVGTRLALEIESGFIDLVLARPVARTWMITRSIIVAVGSLACVAFFMLAGTALGILALAPPTVDRPTASLIAGLAANLALLGVAWSGIALAISATSRRRATAVGITVLIALVTFLLDYIAQLWEAAQPYGWLSPFKYFRPLELVNGGAFPARNFVVLAATALTGFGIAYVFFNRRDISR